MEKYNIDYQKEEELVYSYDIESVIKGSNFIQVDLNEDILDSQAVSIILDVLEANAQMVVLLVGEALAAYRVADCRDAVAASTNVFSATISTERRVVHRWKPTVPDLMPLLVEWNKAGKAVLLSRSALGKELPCYKEPKIERKKQSGRHQNHRRNNYNDTARHHDRNFPRQQNGNNNNGNNRNRPNRNDDVRFDERLTPNEKSNGVKSSTNNERTRSSTSESSAQNRRTVDTNGLSPSVYKCVDENGGSRSNANRRRRNAKSECNDGDLYNSLM